MTRDIDGSRLFSLQPGDPADRQAQTRNQVVEYQNSTFWHSINEVIDDTAVMHPHDRGFVVPALTPGAR